MRLSPSSRSAPDAEVLPLAIAARGTYAEQLPTAESQPIGAAT